MRLNIYLSKHRFVIFSVDELTAFLQAQKPGFHLILSSVNDDVQALFSSLETGLRKCGLSRGKSNSKITRVTFGYSTKSHTYCLPKH
uniref:STAS domain-containing protein n=1 Tax=Panagrellus redivivus TaxID=6233 RepID=A0A7E4W5D5_PANRE